MCTSAVPEIVVASGAGPSAGTATPQGGSRRRRLWELSAHAHCPVVGLCLPLKTLRKLIDKTVGATVLADDYALHTGAVADARSRTRTAEAVQRELERRHAGAVRLAATAKTRDALLLWWRAALEGDAAREKSAQLMR